MRLKKRPKPQPKLDTKYLNRKSNDKMMVLADPVYMGHHPSLSMTVKDLITLSEKDEQRSDEFASKVINNTVKQICKNWDVIVTDEPYANKDAEVESCADKYGGEPTHVSLHEKNAHERASSLTLFMNNLYRQPGPIMRRIETVLDRYISVGKPVCVVDSFGVKRYPHK